MEKNAIQTQAAGGGASKHVSLFGPGELEFEANMRLLDSKVHMYMHVCVDTLNYVSFIDINGGTYIHTYVSLYRIFCVITIMIVYTYATKHMHVLVNTHTCAHIIFKLFSLAAYMYTQGCVNIYV